MDNLFKIIFQYHRVETVNLRCLLRDFGDYQLVVESYCYQVVAWLQTQVQLLIGQKARTRETGVDEKESCFIQAANSLGKWWASVLTTSLKCHFKGRVL